MSQTPQQSLADMCALHDVRLPDGYMPNPEAHLGNPRDAGHYEYALAWLKAKGATTVLDVGCYDGWLDFLLSSQGYKVSGYELITELAEAARRYAARNFIDYTVTVGPALDIDVQQKYDAILCFETLEHMALYDACLCVKKFMGMARNGILISLPDQDCKQNAQHKYTPTEELIRFTWGDLPGFKMDYKVWDKRIPGNWFIEVDGKA